MERNRRPYSGPVTAVILDWAGTTVDHGSCAPVAAFRGVFASQRVPVSVEEARAPMGMGKWEHLQAMSRMPRIAQAWRDAHGTDPVDADIDRMFAAFLPRQIELAAAGSAVIAGVAATVHALRARGLKIGSTTGYPREVLAPVMARATAEGYTPDCSVTASDVTVGRPAPWMLLEAARQLNAWPVQSLVKVDDATVGIDAGLAAGCWTVGVTRTGNLVGLTQPEWDALEPSDRDARLSRARGAMNEAGAHFTIDSLCELPAVIDDIERRLRSGEMP